MSAQVPQSPSQEALLLIAQSVCGALERAGITDCDDPGEAIDVMRENLEARVAFLEGERRRLQESASAPQPPAEAQAQGGGEVFDLARARTLADYVVGYARSAELKPLSSDACVALRDLHAVLHTAPPSAPVGVERLVAEMRNFADVADRCQLTEGNAPAAIRAWAERLAQQPAAVDGAVGTVTRVGEVEVQEHRIELDPEFDERLNNMPAGTVVRLYAAPLRDLTQKHLADAAAALATQLGDAE